jgi:membrane protein
MADPVSRRRLRSRVRSQAFHRVDAVRARYSDSWIQELRNHLNAVEFFDRTVVIGAELLWSALPLLILLSSFANHSIGVDVSRNLGLNKDGTEMVDALFRTHPSHALEPVLTSVLICGAGVISVIQSVQVVYERLYGQEHRGWRDLPRYLVWLAVLLAILATEAAIGARAHGVVGEVVQDVVTLIAASAFFAWTIWFLLHGNIPFRDVIPSALATGLLWLALAAASPAYFGPMLVDDTLSFGTIGEVLVFLTWFVLIASVIVLGAALGAVWLNRRDLRMSEDF